MWGASQQENYRTICPEGKLLPHGHKSEVYALTYSVLVALPFYFTLSFLIRLLRRGSQDHECRFSIQFISTGSSMPSLFFLPWKVLLFGSMDPAELLAHCYLLARCSAACDRTFSLAVLKMLPFKVIQLLLPLLL